jgi:hypothetical protein
MATGPELSFIIVTDGFATVRNVVAHLDRQTVAARIELVLVTPSRAGLVGDDALTASLHSVTVVESPIDSLPHARAAGIRAAQAPVIVVGETHAYPHPAYAEALLAAHEAEWAVVGPAMYNANPGSLLGWAALFLDYGPWIECQQRGEMDDVPAHNGSYKRAVLLDLGAGLEEMLESDTVLNMYLRSRGQRLYLEPRARIYHLNVSRPWTWVRERLVAGRAFAASRAAGWPLQRRVAYAAGSPLIPAVRMARTLGYIRASGRVDLLPKLLPALAVALTISALGEFLGYAAGVGGASRPLYEIELHRERYAVAPDP